jgi:hypothetical protein
MDGTNRMNREQFAAATAGLGEADLRKALWTVYWRGTAAVRERIEDILAPAPAGSGRGTAPPAPDPDEVLQAVQEFTALVRSGAYIGQSRRPAEGAQPVAVHVPPALGGIAGGAGSAGACSR